MPARCIDEERALVESLRQQGFPGARFTAGCDKSNLRGDTFLDAGGVRQKLHEIVRTKNTVRKNVRDAQSIVGHEKGIGVPVDVLCVEDHSKGESTNATVLSDVKTGQQNGKSDGKRRKGRFNRNTLRNEAKLRFMGLGTIDCSSVPFL